MRTDTLTAQIGKYGNVRTAGYASRKEANRAAELRLLEKSGAIRNLREQVSFVLIPRQLHADGSVAERSCVYIADFTYDEEPQEPGQSGWQPVVEDAKGVRTEVFRIKRKLMRFTHGIAIRET